MEKKSGKSYKYKSLLVWQILLNQTDTNHPLTAKEISDELEYKYDIVAEEHSIRRDINELIRLYGEDEKAEFMRVNAYRIK